MLAPALGSHPVERVVDVLSRHVSRVTAHSIMTVALRRVGQSEDALAREGVTPALLDALQRGVQVFLRGSDARTQCLQELAALGPARPRPLRPISVPVRDEDGVVDARTRARQLASELGFDSTLQIKIATAVSELARNIQRYAGSGFVLLDPQTDPRRGLRIVARDTGPGIPHVEEVLAGSYRSRTGMGLGLRGCRQLMDEFEIQTASGIGTTVRAAKWL